MKDLLNKYSEANRFSLSERFSYLNRLTGEYSYYYLSDDECDQVIEKLELETYTKLKKIYEESCLEYDYDTLFHDIKNECFLANDRFIADKNLSGETAYESNTCIWKMYKEINYMTQAKRTLLELSKKGELNEESKLFETREYGVLCKHIIDSEITFGNHSTNGQLFRTYYFELNDITRNWLLGRENVFNFGDGLEDLALYLDEKLLYSSSSYYEKESFYKPTKQKGNMDNLMALLGKDIPKMENIEEKEEDKKTRKTTKRGTSRTNNRKPYNSKKTSKSNNKNGNKKKRS